MGSSWEAQCGIQMVTSGQVQIEALNARHIKKIVVASYSNDDINSMVSKYLVLAGFDVLENAGLELPFEQVGNLSHHQAYALTKQAVLRHPECDGILFLVRAGEASTRLNCSNRIWSCS